MAVLTLTAQDVNGDPFVSGSNINIVNGSTTELTFTDFDFQLYDPQPGETVSLDGGVTQLSYTFLGYGDVRNDVLQGGAFIRVDMGDGTFQTFAIDMNADGDQQPTLQTGNTKLTVAGLDTTTPERFPAPACFTPGTLISTPDGPRPVEALMAGDLITTLDDGDQPVRAVLRRSYPALGRFAPILFDEGAIGNDAPLLVSPQHRMLVTGWQAELVCGQSEVLVAARHLVNGGSITIREGGFVSYLHLLFDRHQIVFGAGAPSESYLPGGLDMPLDAETQSELTRLFPDLADRLKNGCDTVRPVLRRREAVMLAA